MTEVSKRRLQKATITLSALPVSSLDKPLQMRSAWPDFIQKTQPILEQKQQKLKVIPNAVDIDDAMAVIDILNKLSGDRRRLIWARACGVPWAALQLRYGSSRTHLNLRYKKALTEFMRLEKVN